MRDFLTKKQSTNVSIHQQSTNSAYEVANQLRNELYDKLNTFRNKKSPINKDKSMFSVIPQTSHSNTSLGSSKFKNLQISTEYPSIEAQVGQSYYSRVKQQYPMKDHQQSTIMSCKSSQKSTKNKQPFIVYKSTKPLTVPKDTKFYTGQRKDNVKRSKSGRVKSQSINVPRAKDVQTCKNTKKTMFSFRETVKVPSVGGKSQKYILLSQRSIDQSKNLTNNESSSIPKVDLSSSLLAKADLSSSMLAKAAERPQNLYFVRQGDETSHPISPPSSIQHTKSYVNTTHNNDISQISLNKILNCTQTIDNLENSLSNNMYSPIFMMSPDP